MPRLRSMLVTLLFPALFPLLARSQGKIAPPHAPADSLGAYQDSPDGLRMQLLDILAVARERNFSNLESLIKKMEIPNYEDWFALTYGKERAEVWAMLYGRDLARNESDFEMLFLQLANEEGEIATRKVNDSPAPGMEAHMLDGLQGTTEIFFASWKKRDASSILRSNPIGYFVFVDGKFRWDSPIYVSGINSQTDPNIVAPQEIPGSKAAGDTHILFGYVKNNGPFQPGVGGVTNPSCTFCPDPEYTNDARAKHLEGTVVLRAIIQPNGHTTDIVVLKSPDPGLAEKAVQALSKWRFKPARRADGEAVPVIVPIEITFRLLK